MNRFKLFFSSAFIAMIAFAMSTQPSYAQFSKALGSFKKKTSGNSATASNAPSGSGKTYYVSPTGSARGDGSQAKPLKDIQKAIDKAQNGDVINIAAGNYLGKLNQGFIEINNKYISLIGGWNADFSEHNPAKHITEIRPTPAQTGTASSKGNIHIMAKGQPNGTIIIDGIAIDRGQSNLYCAPDPNNPKTSTPKDGKFETGRILHVMESPVGPKIGGLSYKEPLIRLDIEGNLIVRNCVFTNSPNFAIMGAIRPTGSAEISNNIFVGNCMAAVQIVGNSIKQDQVNVSFHHNTVLFSWCRDKEMGDMGYGYRFMTGLHQKVYNNIFGCSNLGAIDRGPLDSNAAIEEKRETSAYDNYFFMNKADLILPSGGGLWLEVAAEQFEEADQIDEYEGNRQLPASETAFVEAINQDYLKAFCTISSSNKSNFDPNSLANTINKAFGMNQQGSETIRPSMYANRYPYEEVFKLWGKVKGYGAQTEF